MLKLKPIFTILLFLTTFFSFSQEKYRVVYDYKKDVFQYYKLNKNNKVIDTLKSPKFKRNSLVEIKLLNVNPFAVGIKTDVKEEELHASSGNGFNFSNLLGGISSLSNNNLEFNINSISENDALFFGDKGKSRGESARGKIANKFSELNSLQTNVDAMKKTLIADLINPNMTKDQILNNLKAVASNQRDTRISDPNKNFHVFISTVKQVVQEDANDVANDIDALSSTINQNTQEDKQLSRGELVAQNVTYNKLKSMLSNLSKTSSTTSLNLDKVEELYTSLEASSFEQTYDYEIEADKVNLELNFIQSEFADTQDQDNNQNVIKKRNLKMYSKGGFKINTSVAFTLNNFGSTSKDYFIDQTGIIGADANEHFVPNLSTMVNFYPVIGENFNIGGSFGVSIPISGDVSGINFLLGPSIFLGSKSRLAISGGAAYGPVKKLTNGFKVGDTTEFNDIDSFTKDVYEFGYYLGISFSLFNLK